MSAVGVGRHCWWTPGHPLPSLHFNPSFCYKKLMSRLFLMHSSVFLYPRHFLTLFPCLECSTFLCPDKNLMTSNQTSSTFPESMIILVLLVWKKKKKKESKKHVPRAYAWASPVQNLDTDVSPTMPRRPRRFFLIWLFLLKLNTTTSFLGYTCPSGAVQMSLQF